MLQEATMRENYPEVKLPIMLKDRPNLLAIGLVSVLIVAFLIALPL